MAPIIIDGYNVTGVLLGDMEAARGSLIQALSEYKRRKGHDITVVFDGHRDGRGAEQRQVTGGVKVIYTALGESADSVIKKTVTGERQWIVITSDREIQRHVWARNSVPIDSEEFLRILERGSVEAEYPGDGEDDGYHDGVPNKGNPRKTSKKQKAVERALKKL